MNCSRCQHPVPDEALYCSSCGTSTATRKLEQPTLRNVSNTDPHDNRKTLPQLDQRVGLILDSKYQLLDVLGQGGMGSVYLARRLHIGDEVAVKLLSPDLLRDERAIERFRREARSAAMIRHPNVVSIHDFSDAVSVDAASEAYIVMELVKGVSLRTILQREGLLSPARAVAIMRDVCAGVGAAHRQGLLHRDLKPDNVIIAPPVTDGEQETAKVVDFGLAKINEENISPLTKAGAVLGTLVYMSPEQCRGEELDARADVYSLGAMLYEMLTGQPPFVANTQAGLIAKHLTDVPPQFNTALQIPLSLERICLRALAKSSRERQSDALVLGKELQAALAVSGEVQSDSKQVTQPTSKSPEQKTNLWKWIVGLVVVAVLGLTLIAFGIAVKFWLDCTKDTNSSITTSTEQRQPTTNPDEENRDAPQIIRPGDLRGTWTGTYGPTNQPAKLIITRHDGDAIEGVLEQSSYRVVFEGSITSEAIRMTQTKVLAGEGWSLGEDTGTVSKDGNRISGTGSDPIGGTLGITYQWSFSRRIRWQKSLPHIQRGEHLKYRSNREILLQ